MVNSFVLKISRSFIVDLAAIAIILIAYLAIALPRYHLGLDWSDEGFLAYGAERVAEGEVPNRDFVSLQPPLSFYTLAFVYKIAGASIASERAFGVFVHVFLGLLIYAIARQFVRPAFALAAALPMSVLGMPLFAFAPFAVWQGAVASLLAMLLYLRGVFSGSKWLALASGTTTAISLGLRHDQAFYLILSLFAVTVVFTLRRPTNAEGDILRQTFVPWVIGLAAALLLLIALWLNQGSISAMWRQLVLFPLTTYAKTSSIPFPRFDGRLPPQRNALNLLCYLPLFTYVALGGWIVRRLVRCAFDSTAAIATALLAWSALMYCQMLARSDAHHFLPALPAFLVLAAFCAQQICAALPKLWARINMSILLAFAGAYLWFIRPVAIADPHAPGYELLNLRRGGIRAPGANWVADFIKGVQDYVPPNRSILALPYEPLFYFLCERRNPTHWNYLWPGDQTPNDHAELVTQAKKDPPAVILVTNEEETAKSASIILDYVHADYKFVGRFGQLNIYFPNDVTPP
jgi:hypothetical protein